MSGTHGTHRSGFGTESVMLSAERVEARKALLKGARRQANLLRAATAAAERQPASMPARQTRRQAKQVRMTLGQAAAMAMVKSLQEQLDDALAVVESMSSELGDALDRASRLAATVDELADVVESLEGDLEAVLSARDDELMNAVRTFLGARHRKGPGVQQIVKGSLDRMAVLSGYFDLEDGG